MKNISRKNKSYSENTHFYVRIWSIVSVVMMMVFPIVAGIVFDAWPTASAVGIRDLDKVIVRGEVIDKPLPKRNETIEKELDEITKKI